MMTGVAIIGAGHWGPHLLRNFNDHLASQVLWLVDLDEGRRKAMSERFPALSVSDNLEDALGDDRVDAVVVATPTSTHANIVERSLTAGKHVLVEKPIADSLVSARRLCHLADDSDLTLMVGHVFLFNNAIRAADEYMAEGSLGPIRYVSMTRTNLGPVRIDVNAAWDLASHDVSIANSWLGGAPRSVNATGGSWLNEHIEDVVVATLKYPGNVLVHIEASWLNPQKRRLIAVVGEERMLTVDDLDLTEPLRIYDKGVVRPHDDAITDTYAGFRSKIREGQVLIPHVTSGEPLKAECESFLRRIRGSDEQVSDGWEGAQVVAVLEAIDKSIQSGGLETDVEPAR
jgi:predicted dehydrogenase